MRLSHWIVCVCIARLIAADDPAPGSFPITPRASDVGFLPTREPLRPSDDPLWQDPINRERVYDYYAKQAIWAMAQPILPTKMPAFPGLDGGQQGHWGNQNDQVTWRDGRWAAAQHGNLFSGVLHETDLLVPKAVWVREGSVSGCFDPVTLRFVARWTGGFLRLSDRRHGFNSGPRIEGFRFSLEKVVPAESSDTYHGFYRSGDKVYFSYTLGGQQYLDSLTGGRQLRQPGVTPVLSTARWPRWIETVAQPGSGDRFAVDTLTLPFDNPYGTLFFISGFDFFEDGRSAAVCTMTGEVWLVRGIDDNQGRLRWKRYATGLHQPLGLKIISGNIHVLGRDQVTRLDDLNHDDEADFYACVTNAYITSPGTHDYIVGLDVDKQGRLYTASANQGLLRLTPPRGVDVLATGLRNPNGIALATDGAFLVSQGQEGDWTPASALFQVELGANTPAPYFGHGGPMPGRKMAPPLLQLPRGVDNSSGGGVVLSETGWPALRGKGNFIHLSYGAGSAFLITRQNIAGVWQGAATRITGALLAGPQHARFNQRDGHLYVSGMTGWGTYAPADGCLQRIRRVGAAPVLISHEIRSGGVALKFDQPLDPAVAADAKRHFAQAWNYRYSPAYGSPEFMVSQTEAHGHDVWRVQTASVSSDRYELWLGIPQLVVANQVHLRVALSANVTQDIFLTVHAVSELSKDRAISDADHANHAASIPQAAATHPSKWEQEVCGLPYRKLELRAATGLKFEQTELQAQAGEPIALHFENPDDMPHNWVLTVPDAADAVARAADMMVAQTDGFSRNYVPEMSEILCHSRVMMPRTRTTLYFNAPVKPGRYPYLCTFPGHAQMMRGVLVVEPAR